MPHVTHEMCLQSTGHASLYLTVGFTYCRVCLPPALPHHYQQQDRKFMCPCHQEINESWEDRGGSQCSEPWLDLVATQPSNMMMISCPISHPAKIYNKWWGLIIKMALCITWRVIIVCIHMMILNPCVFPHIGMQCWDWVLFGFSTPNCWGQESLAFFWRSL